jgi:hypothetical protein
MHFDITQKNCSPKIDLFYCYMHIFAVSIVESARDVPYRDIHLQELILRAHRSVVFKDRRAG